MDKRRKIITLDKQINKQKDGKIKIKPAIYKDIFLNKIRYSKTNENVHTVLL